MTTTEAISFLYETAVFKVIRFLYKNWFKE